jgi:hypothetical protein
LDQQRNSPRVSVALTAYNAQKFLAETIESVLAQDFAEFEFLLLDDGSTDRTAEIANSYAARDTRIRVISRENRGMPASLNQLFAEAHAPLVARLDADDVCEPTRFSQQVAFLDEHPDHGIVGSQASAIDEAGKRVPRLDAPVPCAHEDIVAALPLYSPFYHPAVMVRRDLVIAAGGYRDCFRDTEDYDLWLRLSERTRMANLPEPLLNYRWHLGQTSTRNMAGQARKAAIAWLAHLERVAGRPDPTEGLAALPPDDRIDALFGAGSLEYVRARVFKEISSAPAVREGDEWPVALAHARSPNDRSRMRHIAVWQLRAGRPLVAMRILAALFGKGLLGRGGAPS